VRRRRPPFALVLSALVAGAAIAVLLVSGGPSASGGGHQPTVGVGPSHACARTRAQAEVTARSAIIITAATRAPVRVTEQATGPNGIATVTRSETLTARLRLSQPVSVRRSAAATAGACANAGSFTAAHDEALRKAYATALTAAHAEAARAAAVSLKGLMRRLYPSVLSQARARATARARQLALTAEPALAAQARAQARRRAGASR
jgi:hypothetical protein